MADHFCTFLDFRPLTTNSNFNSLLFLLSNRCYASALARINELKGRPLHRSLISKSPSPTPSSSNFDVISTHEHSDGSLLFRFGNPNEVAKNVEIAESNTVKEEAETEDKDGYDGVRVLDEYHEADMMITVEDGRVIHSKLPEVVDETNSTATTSKSIDVVEGENDLNEKLMVGSNDTELPVSITNEGTGVVSSCVDEKHEDSCPDEISAEDVVEKETDGLARLVPLMAGPVVDVPDNDVSPESLESIVCADESSDSEHKNEETEVISDTIRGGNIDLVSPNPSFEPAINPSEVIIGKGSGRDIDDHMATEVKNVTIVDENELEINNAEAIVARSRSSGAGDEFPGVIVEDIRENGTIQLLVVPPQTEAEPIIEETVTDTTQKSTAYDGAESLISNLILGSARTEVNNNVQNGDLVEASAYEVTGMKSTESATREEISRSDLALFSGAALLPHPSKVLTGGEDAYFIAGETWLGVADGVGHWSLEGTSPGVFAKELTRTCERLVPDRNGDPENNLVKLLNSSVAETHAPGSTTILIAHFDGQALHVANVGDSGFIILRHGTVYKKSSPMFHAFHFPLLVESGDEPSCLAEFYTVDLEEGDVIITATDGVFDNLYDQEISSIVTKALAADKKLEEISKLLAEKAQEMGGSLYGRTPFADEAKAAGYTGYAGGKLDDVAVILSVIQRRQSFEQLT